MNKHRLVRKSKKIQGFFSSLVGPFLRDLADALPGKAKTYIHDKLNEILSTKKKHGAVLKFL